MIDTWSVPHLNTRNIYCEVYRRSSGIQDDRAIRIFYYFKVVCIWTNCYLYLLEVLNHLLLLLLRLVRWSWIARLGGSYGIICAMCVEDI